MVWKNNLSAQFRIRQNSPVQLKAKQFQLTVFVPGILSCAQSPGFGRYTDSLHYTISSA